MELVDKDLELFRQYQELQKKGIINCQIAAQLQIAKEQLANIISHYTSKQIWNIKFKSKRENIVLTEVSTSAEES
mgnify:CR=1 FL=1